MRRLLAVAMALGGCSFGMRRVPPDYDGTSQPDCSDNVAPVVGDSIAAGLLTALGIIEADKSVAANDTGNPDSGADALAIAGLLGGLVFAISAGVGEHNYRVCDDAMAAWRVGGAIAGSTSERATLEAQQFAREHRAELAQADKPKPAPRGYFCASSIAQPGAGFCAREKADCERTRGAAAVAVADLTECALQESTWCSGDVCLPSQGACEARAAKMGSGAPACQQQK